MDVCQKCGDKGDKKRLIYCIKCRAAAEHSYCFDILPKTGKKNVIWTCEECTPREAKPILKPSIRSARISRAVESKLNRIEMLKQKGVSTASKVTTSMQKKGDSLPIGNPSCLKQKSSENAENEESLKRKRQIAIDESSSDVNKPVLAHPVVDPIWRDEKHFDVLTNEMIIHDRALKVVTKALQLFVFHSRNLTPEHWRFCKKYYLWGVARTDPMA